jgi:hypothetical protein
MVPAIRLIDAVRHVRDLIDQKLFRHTAATRFFNFSARIDGVLGTPSGDASRFFYPFKSLEFCSLLLSFWASALSPRAIVR